MRYNLGEKIPFVFLNVDHKGRPPFGGPNYVPWMHDLLGVTVRFLECKEHHKVPIEFYESEGRKADGFIFTDETEGRWFNQYPYAHYGQIDDTNDRRVFKADGDCHSGYFGEWMENGLSLMENVWRGVHQFRTNDDVRKSAEGKADHYANLLEVFYNDLKKQIEEHCKIKLDRKPASFIHSETGEETFIPGFFDVFIVEAPAKTEAPTHLNDPKPGMKIRTTDVLNSTTGMIIHPRHLNLRKPNTVGTLTTWVPGHGGDVWWVKHESDDFAAVYTLSEMTAVQ